MATQLAAPDWALTTDELACYRRDGFVVPRFGFVGRELAELQALSDKLIRENAAILGHPLPGAHVRRDASTGMVCDGGLVRFATHPRLLDLIEQLVGPDVILWHSSLFHKPPEIGPSTPFHQDAAYWPITPPATTTAWIAVRESRRENACLRVVPMSKLRAGEVRHTDEKIVGQGPFDKVADTQSYDAADIVDVELEAGQMVLFDCQIIHGAAANTGTIARTGFSIRYMPATSRFAHGDPVDPEKASANGLPRHLTGTFANTPLIVVRGASRNPGNDLARNQEFRSDL